MSIVKFIIVLSCIATVLTFCNGGEIIDDFSDVLNMQPEAVLKCVNKVRSDLATLLTLAERLPYNSTEGHRTGITPKVGCFIACIFEKKRLMIGTVLQEEKLKDFGNHLLEENPQHIAILTDAIHTCTERVSDKGTMCEVALNFCKCLMQVTHKEPNSLES